MNRSIAAVIAISALSVGCGKHHDQSATPTTSRAGALTSNQDPCVMMDCRRPPQATPMSTSTNTNTSISKTPTPLSTSTSTGVNAEPSPAPPPPTSPADNEADLNATQKMAKNAKLTCKNNDCDPSVGLLTIVTKWEDLWNAGQCTASLVASDVIATNAHCVPMDLSVSGSDCHDRFWITFAQDKDHPEYDKQIGCDKVLFRHKDDSPDGADYAYIKLAHPSNRPVLPISQAGFDNARIYHIHKINPIHVQGGMTGQFMKADCLSLYNSAYFDSSLDSQSQSMLFVDPTAQAPCTVIPGNSGSPIFADDGSVHGVIYSFIDKLEIRNFLAKHGSTIPAVDQISNLNVGSNFACLNMPGDTEGRNLPQSCMNQKANMLSKRSLEIARRVKALRPAAQKQIAENSKDHPEIKAFGWTLTLSENDDTGPVAQGIPGCVSRTAATPYLKGEEQISRPLFYVTATYDQYLRASDYKTAWAGFELNPESMTLGLENDTTYRVEFDDPDNGQVNFKSQLGACK